MSSWIDGLYFAFKVFVDDLRIAVGTFDPAGFFRQLQPNAGVSQCALAAITRHPVAVDNFDLWRGGGHGWFPFKALRDKRLMSQERQIGKSVQ